MQHRSRLTRSAVVTALGFGVWLIGSVPAHAEPVDSQRNDIAAEDQDRDRERDENQTVQCPICPPEIQQALAQLGPMPEPGPLPPVDWPAAEVSVPVSVGLPAPPLPPLVLGSAADAVLPELASPQLLPPPPDLPPPPPPVLLPPPPEPPRLPPPPPPPGLPPPPWPLG
ncbi:hypothetical protein [Mycolicibacterium confluentis]|uniref:Uncharacterized protein n=1 Tax=Mycolicibacterium confluentis TaxID=28047 RepID=A0A7I7XY50_9MYCO|nr:hypothetical protein [Mycolicibacterium confluentis]MCV7318573.1 hypothetical protein [Mycolicibacterium confluentis]ORV23777.1 hypothetical protein AWB99_23370 [Mycolicibacterium confluentis]BBZ33883.1 hypothetical protein MCNF_24880 [Mycolicibacterium confluentis]